MSRDQFNFRCDQELKIYLLKLENASDYIKNLINKDRLKKADPEFIKKRRKELQDQLNQLKEIEKSNKEDSEEVTKILEIAKDQYKVFTQDPATANNFNFYIKNNIMPKLKKARSSKTQKEILEYCRGWNYD